MADNASSLGLAVGSGAPREADGGWLWCRSRDLEAMHAMYAQILHHIRDVEARTVFSYVDEEDARVLSDPLEACPLPEENAEYYELTITNRVASCEYAEPALFEQDVLQLFYNARKWYGIGTEGYGETAVLQRLFQQLTRSQAGLHDGLGARHIKARATDIDVVDAQRAAADPGISFASSKYGPLVEPSPGIYAGMPVVLIDHAVYKGRRYAPGDWVHLMNPADPAWPIVGQIFRVYKRRDIPGDFVSACWYYRPAQTSHVASRTFFANEVVKTGVYGEHAIEDILEDVLVLFHDRYRLARPSAAYWNTDGPVYIVESKYDTQSHAFYRIKSWTSCVPESTQHVITPMDVFAQPEAPPVPEESPLLRPTYGRTGKLLEHAPQEDMPREYPDLFADADPAPQPVTAISASTGAPAAVPGAPSGAGFDSVAGVAGVGVAAAPGAPAAPRPPYTADLPPTHPDRIRAYAAFHSAAHDASLRTSPAGYAELQRELQKRPFASLIEIGALARRLGLPETLVASLRDTALAAGVLIGAPPVAEHSGPVSSAANLAATRCEATFTELPEATRRYFQQDKDGQVLWYAATPLPGSAVTVDGTTRMPMPSLAYLESVTNTNRDH
ncbi:hypothetical protein MCUN1_002673 [Malassezia cuniculi]|uniref:BAH domain-containing protein n=1 Tax=Malassezia cuniculi TaxID=948313 RepID=A0AAF0JBZ8_9BASI|nr:hypothetical protein MCUN1_002673 [Malassezia cuniculi]